MKYFNTFANFKSLLEQTSDDTINEAYAIFPQSLEDIDALNFYNEKENLKNLWTEVTSVSGGMLNPLAISDKSNEKKNIKVFRQLATKLNLKDLTRKFKFNVTAGNGSRGNRGIKSAGFSFENNFAKDVEMYIEEGPTSLNFSYPDIMKKLHPYLENASEILVSIDGGKNTPRPLIYDGKDFVVGGPNLEIGQDVTDVTLSIDGKPLYVSNKFGPTVTFFNTGIKKIFTDSQFENRKITDPQAKRLLEIFGIDESRFLVTFNEYDPESNSRAPKDRVDTTKIADIKAIEKLIRTGVGVGYFMAHTGIPGMPDKFYEVNHSVLDSLTKIQSVTVEYPKVGSAKRIDVKVETPNMQFNFNIRNKQGGLYPSHLMSDYKYKK